MHIKSYNNPFKSRGTSRRTILTDLIYQIANKNGVDLVIKNANHIYSHDGTPVDGMAFSELRLVVVRPIINDYTFMVALHELCHVIFQTTRNKKYPTNWHCELHNEMYTIEIASMFGIKSRRYVVNTIRHLDEYWKSMNKKAKTKFWDSRDLRSWINWKIKLKLQYNII